MISSLTLIQPNPPSIDLIGRKNVSLSWRSQYIPSSSDKTLFGFNLTVCPDVYIYNNPAANTQCLHHILIRGSVDSSGIEDYNAIIASANILQASQDEPDVFSTVFLGLMPNSSYRIQSTILSGNFKSTPSVWSDPFQTNPISAPSPIIGPIDIYNKENSLTGITLEFGKPFDDGGSELLGYSVYIRNHNDHFKNNWKLHGKFSLSSRANNGPAGSTDPREEIFVPNLLPDCTYDFKITAFNEMGESEAEFISSKFYLSSEPYNNTYTSHEIIVGVRNISSLPYSSIDKQSYSIASNLNLHRHLLINDTDQTIKTDDNNRLPVWASHYSPKKFSVAGILEKIGTISSDMEIPNLEGKIALIFRDGFPLSLKARLVQSAGAVGCIIIDNGRCKNYDQKCFPGSDKSRGEYFAVIDHPKSWFVKSL